MFLRIWRKGKTCTLLVGMQPLWKTVWRFLKILKIELPYGPATTLLGIHSKQTKTLIQKYICTTVFIGAYLQ